MTIRVVVACLCGLVAVGVGSGVRAGARPGKPQQPAPVGRDAQAPRPAGTGVIAGVLVAADTGRPVRRAMVNINGADAGGTRSITTDDQGRFNFADLPASAFTVTASKTGFLDLIYGQKRPGSGRPGTPIQLAAGQRLDHLMLRIARGGAITGTILDEQGEPAFGTSVRALRYVIRTGERVLQVAGSAQADDRGVYRIPSLPPGDYVVVATARDQQSSEMLMVAKMKMEVAVASYAASQMLDDMKRVMASAETGTDPAAGYAPVFYPGTPIVANAGLLTLDISEEKLNIDVPLQLVPLTRISGVVTSADGQLPQAVQVSLIDAVSSFPGLDSRSTRVGADGRFSFSGVPPGQYMAIARSLGGASAKLAADLFSNMQAMQAGKPPAPPAPPATQFLWAIAEVATDGRSAPMIALTLQPGMNVSGQVVFDGAAPPTDLSRVRLTLQPQGQSGPAVEMGSAVPPVPIDAEGHFAFSGAVPGRYRLTLASGLGLGNWFLRSAVAGGKDSLDFPLEVKPNENVSGAVLTFSNRPASLSGALQDAAGQTTADYTVVVFAADSRFWTPQSRRVQATRPGTDGHYTFGNLPSGDYRLAVVSDVESGQWYDPAWIRQTFGASIAVSLGEGERKTQDVRVK